MCTSVFGFFLGGDGPGLCGALERSSSLSSFSFSLTSCSSSAPLAPALVPSSDALVSFRGEAASRRYGSDEGPSTSSRTEADVSGWTKRVPEELKEEEEEEEAAAVDSLWPRRWATETESTLSPFWD